MLIFCMSVRKFTILDCIPTTTFHWYSGNFFQKNVRFLLNILGKFGIIQTTIEMADI